MANIDRFDVLVAELKALVEALRAVLDECERFDGDTLPLAPEPATIARARAVLDAVERAHAMSRSLIQEQYEAAWAQKRELRGYGREMVGHYCVKLAGKYVAEVQQDACDCRPLKSRDEMAER